MEDEHEPEMNQSLHIQSVLLSDGELGSQMIQDCWTASIECVFLFCWEEIRRGMSPHLSSWGRNYFDEAAVCSLLIVQPGLNIGLRIVGSFLVSSIVMLCYKRDIHQLV